MNYEERPAWIGTRQEGIKLSQDVVRLLDSILSRQLDEMDRSHRGLEQLARRGAWLFGAAAATIVASFELGCTLDVAVIVTLSCLSIALGVLSIWYAFWRAGQFTGTKAAVFYPVGGPNPGQVRAYLPDDEGDIISFWQWLAEGYETYADHNRKIMKRLADGRRVGTLFLTVQAGVWTMSAGLLVVDVLFFSGC